jgi:uncharacterized protein (TIGR03067 family)
MRFFATNFILMTLILPPGSHANKGNKSHTLMLAKVGLLLVIGGVGSYFLTRAGSTDDREKIQGIWQAISYEDSGRKAPPDVIKNMKWVITKDTITYTQFRDRNTVLTYELDQTKKPKWIDIRVMGEEKDKGHSRGIYELEGETLRVCFSEGSRSKERPTAFESRRDSPNDALFIFQRESR